MHDVSKPVLGQQSYPAHQGIRANLHVPAYQMNVGSGSYVTGQKSHMTSVQLDKPVYTSKNVPFQKLSIDYKL